MTFVLSDEEYSRLKQIEFAALNLYLTVNDLTETPEGKKPILEINAAGPDVRGILLGALVELAVVLGLTDRSPYQRKLELIV